MNGYMGPSPFGASAGSKTTDMAGANAMGRLVVTGIRRFSRSEPFAVPPGAAQYHGPWRLKTL